jgi:hypothetical protein
VVLTCVYFLFGKKISCFYRRFSFRWPGLLTHSLVTMENYVASPKFLWYGSGFGDQEMGKLWRMFQLCTIHPTVSEKPKRHPIQTHENPSDSNRNQRPKNQFAKNQCESFFVARTSPVSIGDVSWSNFRMTAILWKTTPFVSLANCWNQCLQFTLNPLSQQGIFHSAACSVLLSRLSLFYP